MAEALMIDIETLSTSPDAVILSIGLQKFDDVTMDYNPQDGTTLYPSVDEQIANLRDISMATLAFWAGVEHKPTDVFVDEYQRGPCESIARWLYDHIAALPETAELWANGDLFDFGILQNFWQHYKDKQRFSAADNVAPWRYNQPRDLRTLRSETMRRGFDPSTFARAEIVGAPHSALYDCRYQIETLKFIRLFNGERVG